MSAHCKTCNAEIVWAKTDQGKAIPLDATPVHGGNIALDEASVAHYVKPCPSLRQYVTHFATCPQRKQHRRPA